MPSSMTKAERRAQQEAQRAAKLERSGGADPKKAKEAKGGSAKARPPPKAASSATPSSGHALFGHLHGAERASSSELVTKYFSSKGSAEVHPSLMTLGLQTVEGGPAVVGSNARCVAMLSGFKRLISEYVTPPGKHISRDLASSLSPSIGFLSRCRPLAISMGSAIRWLKSQIASLPLTMSEREAKATLIDAIDSYVQEKVVFAHAVIADFANCKIRPGETVLTFGYSDVIEEMLKRAHDVGKVLKVIVVDARPRMEGKTMLSRLVAYGIQCSYVLLNAVSYVMKDVSKVFIGAVAMLNNGTAMGRAGTAMVALTANAYNTPVMVCCETYKFCERAQLDSICFNELGSLSQLIAPNEWPAGEDVREKAQREPLDLNGCSSLSALNLCYDITPIQFIAVVVTEVGMIPPTSVPVIIREYNETVH